MPTTAKLSDTQLAILSQAAQRPDGAVRPLPSDLQAKGGVLRQAMKALLKRGFIIEQCASKPDEEWRRDENDRSVTLVITPEGLAAIGLKTDVDVPEASEPTKNPRPPLIRAPPDPSVGPDNPAPGDPDSGTLANQAERPNTKGEVITALLRRETGATLDELTAATGWQAHSVRGFLSGALKKKLGLAVASERGEDGVWRYRITA